MKAQTKGLDERVKVVRFLSDQGLQRKCGPKNRNKELYRNLLSVNFKSGLLTRGQLATSGSV